MHSLLLIKFGSNILEFLIYINHGKKFSITAVINKKNNSEKIIYTM